VSAPKVAGNPEFSKRVQEQVSLLTRKGWYHSIELPDGTLIPGLISVEAQKLRLASFPIPQELTGKRVLDVGAAGGWCSFEMERRGADVVAVDCVEVEEFHIARKLLGSQVDYRLLDVDELSPDKLGRFDYVLFFGVLYHLRHPLLGLEKICALTTDTAFIESFVIDGDRPAGEAQSGSRVMEFYETNELGGQIDNWFGPSVGCLLSLCRASGFARVELEQIVDCRAGVTCRRHWEPPSSDPPEPAPWVNSAVNNRTNDIYFHPLKDEYICIYFKSHEPALTRDQIRVEIDGYGVNVLVLAELGRQGWQVNLKVPPGLDPGPHQVRVRTLHSLFSNTFQIFMRGPGEAASEFAGPAVACPLESATEPAPFLYEVENNMSGTRLFHGYRNEHLCCFFLSSEPGLTRRDVIVEMDGRPEPVLFLADLGTNGWQTNSRIPAWLEEGRHEARLRTLRSPYSNAVEIRFERLS